MNKPILIFCAVIFSCLLAFGGCSQPETTEYGQISAIDGEKITVTVGTYEEPTQDAQTEGDSDTEAYDMNSSDTTRVQPGQGGGTPPERPAGDNAAGTTDGETATDNTAGTADGETATDNAAGATDGTTTQSGEASALPEGETPQEGEAPAMPDGEAPQDGEAPAMPEGETPQDGEAPAMPEGEAPQDGEAPAMPEGEAPQDGEVTELPDGEQPQGGTPPEGGGFKGGAMGVPGFTAGDETKDYTIDDSVSITDAQGNAVTTGDLQEGAVIAVTLKAGKVTAVEVLGSNSQPGGDMSGGGSGSETGSIDLVGAFTVDGEEQSVSGETYTSESENQNAVLVTNSGSLSLDGGTLSKTGDTTSDDESNFYALNAVFAAVGGSTATVTNTTLTSNANGANAIFASGTGSEITVEDVTIETQGDSSRGLDATYGGTVTANGVEITTQGAHCAPIATDRGEGTVTVTKGTLSSAGDGSPCIYSTGDITVSDTNGTAADSQCAVVEGKNSISLTNCDLTGAGSNGVMLYQSTSGDAAEGTAVFTAEDSTLKTTSDGAMFYITNTTAEATLTNTTLDFTSGILAEVAGNETNNWGTPGSNGGNFTLTAVGQTLNGDITCDDISTVTLNLTEKSQYTGIVNGDNTASSASVSLDADSTWTLTGDSYVTTITNADTNWENIVSDGHTIYYNSEENPDLNGETITLLGGGSLEPVA